jgi:hypothetical protein
MIFFPSVNSSAGAPSSQHLAHAHSAMAQRAAAVAAAIKKITVAAGAGKLGSPTVFTAALIIIRRNMGNTRNGQLLTASLESVASKVTPGSEKEKTEALLAVIEALKGMAPGDMGAATTLIEISELPDLALVV